MEAGKGAFGMVCHFRRKWLRKKEEGDFGSLFNSERKAVSYAVIYSSQDEEDSRDETDPFFNA